MNYFKIDGRQYRAEVCATLTGYLATISAPSLFNVGWEAEFYALRDSRPAARRVLKREIERLAIGPDGKRANWTIARRREQLAGWGRAAASTARAAEAFREVAQAAVGAGAMAAILEPLHKFAEVNR